MSHSEKSPPMTPVMTGLTASSSTPTPFNRTRRVRDRHPRALVVGVQVAAATRPHSRTLVPHHRFVHPGAVDVAVQDRPG